MNLEDVYWLVCMAMDRLEPTWRKEAPPQHHFYMWHGEFVHEMDEPTLKALFVKLYG